mmetsp:Transcript_4896/g.18384  ORF Transcript_4896/g.18384 Transcript_4896/m.18384 type:complete len:387 (+) Transcript_4896:1134-2294(+)
MNGKSNKRHCVNHSRSDELEIHLKLMSTTQPLSLQTSSTMPNVQLGLLQKIKVLIENASKRGSLKSIETTKHYLDKKTTLFIASEKANKKPSVLEAKIQQQEEEVDNKNPTARPEIAIDPFNKIEDDLCLTETEHYAVAHNKFCVYTNHLLLITKHFQAQMEHLHESDFKETGNLLLQDGWESGEWLIFYNRGVFSGCSQPHKHIQILRMVDDDGTERFPVSKDLETGDNSFMNYRHSYRALRGDESMAELHRLYVEMLYELGMQAEKRFDDVILHEKFVEDTTKLEEENDGYDLYKDVNHLQLLVGNRLLTLDMSAERIPSYNLLFTSKWMVIIPRRYENCQGISGNSLIFLRSFFVKDESTKQQLLGIGINEMLQHLTFPIEQN